MSPATMAAIALCAALAVACSGAPSQHDGDSNGKPVTPAASTKYYQVKKGDTLYGIAQAVGHDYRDIAAWNGLANADVLVAGQTLRMAPPEGNEQKADGTSAAAVAANGAAAATPAANRDATAKKAKPPYQDASDPFANLGRLSAGSASPSAAPAGESNSRPASPLMWARPCRNKLLSPYLDGVNRGMDFDGAIGDPIFAAASGKVTLVTNALRGYGNLVVIKHEGNFVSVYTHASKILIHEGQIVAKGQKIAEIGSSDSDRPKLHFEIRLSGRPMDPAKFLPPA